MAYDCRQFKIGEVYLMDFDGFGNEQLGLRPGLVFQNNCGNEYSPNIIVLPLTTAIKKIGQPTHVIIKSNNSGLKYDSMVLCENPKIMSKDRIGRYITSLSDEYMSDIAEASLLATSVIAFIDPEKLLSIWEKAIKLNLVA